VIVVDASVLADALIDDGPQGESARAELTSDSQWAAPAHLLVEVVSVIRGKVLGGKLGLVRAAEAIGALSQLVVIEVGAGQLVDRMWELRGNLTAYDAAYVAAAEMLGCPLITGDARLVKANGVRCVVRLVPRS
jgi:predicted nucleic acid-binding protein